MMRDKSSSHHHAMKPTMNNAPAVSSTRSSTNQEIDRLSNIPTTIVSPRLTATNRQSRSCHDRVSTGNTIRNCTVSCSKSTKKNDCLLKLKNTPSKSCHESPHNSRVHRKGTKKSLITTYQTPKPLGEEITLDISFANQQCHDHSEQNSHKLNVSKSEDDDNHSDVDDEYTFFTHSLETTSKSEDYEDDEYHGSDIMLLEEDVKKLNTNLIANAKGRRRSYSANSGSTFNREDESTRQSPVVKEKTIRWNHENTTRTSNNIQVVVRIRPLDDVYRDEYLKVVRHSNEYCKDFSGSTMRQGNNDDDDIDILNCKHASTSTIHIQQPVVHTQNHSTLCHQQISCSSSSSTTCNKVHHHQYTFDKVIDNNINQTDMYHETGALKIVTDCIATGHNATVLTYGQTGSGKTYTLLGPSLASSSTVRTSPKSMTGTMTPSDHHKKVYNPPPSFPAPSFAFIARLTSNASNVDQDDTRGIIPRAIETIFRLLEDARNECSVRHREGDKTVDDDDDALFEFQSQVQITLLELYGENLRDLLCESDSMSSPKVSSSRRHHHNTNNLSIRDVTVHVDSSVNGNDTNDTSLSYVDPEVVGATSCIVSTYEEAMTLLSNGLQHRSTRCTKMNECSSRSHVIVTITVEQKIFRYCPCTNQFSLLHSVKKSKLNCVDLAGSERQKRTHSRGQSFKEAIGINKGLMALGNVISALAGSNASPSRPTSSAKRDEKVFIPYRDSKLTRLLQGSLGGNHKTLMITCISSSVLDLDETIMCLRYANRAKNIQNKVAAILPSNRLSPHDEQQVLYNNIVLAKEVSSLQKQLQVIASELLQVLDGNISNPQKYTKDVLRRLLSEQNANSQTGARSFLNTAVTGPSADKSVLDETYYDRFDCQSLISSNSSFSYNAVQQSVEDGASLASTTSVTCSETSAALDETTVSPSLALQIDETTSLVEEDFLQAFDDSDKSVSITDVNNPTIPPQFGAISRPSSDKQFTSLLDLYLTLFTPRLTSISLRTDRIVNPLQSRASLPSGTFHPSLPSLDYFRSLSFTN